MSKAVLEKASREIDAKNAEAKKFYDDLGDNEPSADQVTFIKDLNKTLEEMEHRYKDLELVYGGKDLVKLREEALRKPERKSPTDYDAHENKSRGKTIADEVLENDEFKTWRDRIAPGAPGQKYVQGGAFGNSPKVNFEKSLITGANPNSAGALIENDRKPILDMFYQRPLTIRDLVTAGQTESDTVTFARQLSVTNNATVVAEATASGDGSGAKPKSGFTLESVSVPVKTIAHWLDATRQALADASQMRTLINEFLLYGLDEELEDQMVKGSGTGQNFTGIYNVVGVQTQAFDTDNLVTLRRSRTKLRVVGRCNPNAWAMNPEDWEEIELSTDNEGRYLYGGPAVLSNPRVWSMPVVESEAVTAGDPIGAEWRFAVLWDRMQSAIYATDSHADYFVRNLIAILAEMRAAFDLIRPAAFIVPELQAA